MRLREAALLFAAALIAALICATPAAADDNLGEQLRSQYQNKVLVLRHFYKGDHFSFQSDGTLNGVAEIGPWTVFGEIFIKSIAVDGRNLRLEGRRVSLVFDDRAKSLRDILDYLGEASRAGEAAKKKEKDRDKRGTSGRDKIKEYYLNRNIEIEIALVSDNPDLKDVSAALTAVFLKGSDSLADFAPDFWHDYLDQLEGRPPRVPQTTETIYRVERNVVSPPRPIRQAVPVFSDEARMVKLQGVETLSVEVDASGMPTEIQILTPLGLGLDENGVDALRNWKFEPARKGQQPVPVKIAVEMDFHL